jgi:hypothetical protein
LNSKNINQKIMKKMLRKWFNYWDVFDVINNY